MDYPSNGTGNEKQHNITRGQMDKMTTAELLQLLEQINEDMTEDNFDDDLITACLDALDQKSTDAGTPVYRGVVAVFQGEGWSGTFRRRKQ